MPNPKGTPENLQPFTSQRDEPLDEQINVKVTKTMKEAVQSQENPPEFVRGAIQDALDKQKQQE